MNRFYPLVCLVFLFTGSLLAQEPSARDIADAYIENTGGAEAYKNLESLRMTGTSTMQGMEFPIVITTNSDDKLHVEVDVQGQTIIQAYDGEKAWQVMPFQGITTPTEMADEEGADLKETIFLSEFVDSEERGFTLERLDDKEIEGTQTHAVRVTNEAGIDRTYYFDTEYFVPVMMSSVSKGGQGKGMTVEVYMSDYQEVDGMTMPMFLDTHFNGQSVQKITIKEVEMNAEVDDAMFSIPE